MRDSELKYFKELLSDRQKQILQNIESNAKDLEVLGDQSLSDELDYASASTESLVGSSISLQQQKELREIEVALAKIKSGTYGICEMCEDPISIQRLKVKPHAKYCIVCREIVEKNR
ncbi:RNA polymerase-binding protein DksA [Wolinella succinogenes]|jgi:DnaK suppressor protein|uniref:DKSA-LIKE PROTEIN n=1 Tax=Wolinella succinogenes (strain ATCC 29543 / DSM 1740 / CCUG 13145 / JCM 31913 / LMG 7466 / NCTC 11488 / FDC 602W) TaxID=273121 RepID=Q7MAM1_WOLSU|nr:RNA polymerase-binding protein DksA [Wolinella succinogenes]NLU35268.1 RNA polymerase-binding protein DksA [Wolinella succinogenes]CAE09318.1 DKSA-LIKE PROTEIN [Wolinella succinogenes]VEG81530.1 DnaK suppressor protein [Wolinella succinogenes]HCZ18841.1 RNA polymerase-binding protein DksA [Helicobacter sp.]